MEQGRTLSQVHRHLDHFFNHAEIGKIVEGCLSGCKTTLTEHERKTLVVEIHSKLNAVVRDFGAEMDLYLERAQSFDRHTPRECDDDRVVNVFNERLH